MSNHISVIGSRETAAQLTDIVVQLGYAVAHLDTSTALEDVLAGETQLIFVFLDGQHLDRLSAVARVRELAPSVPVVGVLPADTMERNRIRTFAAALGMRGELALPLNPGALVRIVEHLLGPPPTSTMPAQSKPACMPPAAVQTAAPVAPPTSQGPTSQGPTSQGPTSQGPTSSPDPIGKSSERPELLADAAEAAMTLGYSTAATRLLRWAVELRPRDAHLMARLEYGLGLALAERGQNAEARSRFEHASQLAPEDSRATDALHFMQVHDGAQRRAEGALRALFEELTGRSAESG